MIARFLGKRAGAAAGAPGMLSEVVLKDITLKLAPTAAPKEVEATLTVGREVAKHPGDCKDPGIAGMGEHEGPTASTCSSAARRWTALSDALRGIVEKLSIGEVSEPYASREGIRMFMLCERVETAAPLADREETAQRLYRQKLELEVEKYLRKLRREATVDVRGAQDSILSVLSCIWLLYSHSKL